MHNRPDRPVERVCALRLKIDIYRRAIRRDLLSKSAQLRSEWCEVERKANGSSARTARFKWKSIIWAAVNGLHEIAIEIENYARWRRRRKLRSESWRVRTVKDENRSHSNLFKATERLCTANLSCSTKRKLVVVYDYCENPLQHTSLFSPESICIQPQIWKTVVDLRKIMNIRHMMVRSEVATAMPPKIVATCNETIVSKSCMLLFYAGVQISQLTWDDIDGMSIISSSLPTQLSLSSFFSHTRHSPIRPPVSDSDSPTHSVGKKEHILLHILQIFIYTCCGEKESWRWSSGQLSNSREPNNSRCGSLQWKRCFFQHY